jgi:hypothetical protein
VFLAVPADIQKLVDAYAAQHKFRVLSNDPPPEAIRTLVRATIFPRERSRHAISGVVAELVLEDGERLLCPVLDLSNRGLAIRLEPGKWLLLPGTSVSSIALYQGNSCVLDGVSGTVRYAEAFGSGSTGGAAYKIGLELRRSIERRRDEAHQLLAEPVRVMALLQELRGRSSLTVRLADTEVLVSIAHGAVMDASAHKIFVDGEVLSGVEVGDVVEVRFELRGSSYSFLTSILEVIRSSSTTSLALRMPRAARSIRQRRSLRIRPPADRPVLIKVTSPFVGELEPRPALNITASGAAFSISEDADLLPVGTRIPELSLRFHDGTVFSCRASVRTLATPSDAENRTTMSGVEFEGLSTTERARIADAIVHAGQPELRDGTGLCFDALWSFLLETGFLYPKKLDSIVISDVRTTLSRLLARPNDVLKTSLVLNAGVIEGHISCVRAYHETWMPQHLAASGQTTMARGRMLNLAMIGYLEQLPSIEWIKLWYRPTNPWPARVFGNFARKLGNSGLSDLRTHRYMVSSTLTATESIAGPSIRAGEPDDHVAIEAYFIAAREAVLLRSDDLTRRHLMLDEVRKTYATLGLTRRREILIAEDAGRFVGFALLEISSPGLNLSELTNTFRVFTLDGDDRVRRALILAARSRYRELGSERAIALAADGDEPSYEALGFVEMRQYCCWSWHRSLYQDIFEHLLKLRV